MTESEQTRGTDRTWGKLKGDELLDEANALALYVGRHGDGLFGNDADKGDDDRYRELLTAIAEATSSPSASSWKTLMQAYSRVSSVTYEKRGVNGRSVLDTANRRRSDFWSLARLGEWWRGSQRYRAPFIGVVLFFLALFVHQLLVQSGGSTSTGMSSVVEALAPLLVPALWGGIGACTFLAKHLSNKLSEQAYELARQQGDIVRIFLGAMIGVLAVVLLTDFGVSVANSGGQQEPSLNPMALGPTAIAFVSGLAVKPIYAGVEALSNALARRLQAD